MDKEKILRSVGTHNGTFHADEVTACALLLLFDQVDLDKVYRTRDSERLACCEFVCDVGGVYDESKKLFDHHQSDYVGLFSSAGMVLDYLRTQALIPENEANLLKHGLVDGVDAHDNGRAVVADGYCSFSNVVSNFTPLKYNATAEEQDQAFFQALEFVRGHISRMLGRFRYNLSCRGVIEEKMREGRDVLIFDEALPWLENFFALGGKDHPAEFIISPAGEHWKLRGIPPSYEKRMQVRVPLPESWAGLLGEELEKVSQIKGAVFCHKGRFISVWETKEAALEALSKVMELRKGS